MSSIYGQKNGCSLLLYKDSRADMILLDETVGIMNWQRSHLTNVLYIWDRKSVGRQGTGESFRKRKKACIR